MFGVRRIQSHRVLPGEFVYILTQRNFRKVLLTLFFSLRRTLLHLTEVSS